MVGEGAAHRIAQDEDQFDRGVVGRDPLRRHGIAEIGGGDLADRARRAGPAEVPLVPGVAPIVAMAEEVQLLRIADEDLGMLAEHLVDPGRRALLGAYAEKRRLDHPLSFALSASIVVQRGAQGASSYPGPLPAALEPSRRSAGAADTTSYSRCVTPKRPASDPAPQAMVQSDAARPARPCDTTVALCATPMPIRPTPFRARRARRPLPPSMRSITASVVPIRNLRRSR